MLRLPRRILRLASRIVSFAASLALFFLPWVFLLKAGAAWGEEPIAEPAPGSIAAPEETHWAFRPLAGPRDGESETIDTLIAGRLAREGLAPSAEADRRTLARRLSLVVHGFAPSPELVERFAADRSPRAYADFVDELLASPRYGERMARHWLDLVRYSESNGFETNRPRPNAWHYRDWVIRAFNEDMPYGRFVEAQIAGDAIGEPLGTGFLVAGVHDIVTSPDEELTKMQRADELADFVHATSTVFLGLTVACAKCHDHKFDPIPQRDYYAMAAVFAGVRHADRELPRIPLPAERAKLEELIAEVTALERELASLSVRPAVRATTNTEVFAPVDARFVRMTILASSGGEPCIDELEVYSAEAEEESARNVALASSGVLARASGTLPGYEIHQVRHLNDGEYGNARSWISNTPGRGWVELELPRVERVARVVWGRDRKGQYTDRLASRYLIEVARERGEWTTVASSEDRLPLGVSLPVAAKIGESRDAGARAVNDENLLRARPLIDRLERLQEERAALERGLASYPAWVGTFHQPGPTHLLYRGDPLAPREVVGPDAISSLGALQLEPLGLDAEAPEATRRLRLARWIASPRNALAARVLVNRLWQYAFGRGLVPTPNDFGENGVAPSHPDLLDHLARELLASGGSMKHVLREILLSQTFRQSSAYRAEAFALDGGNRLLWRFAPRRVEAEVIRDSMLSVSGSLDLRMGGPGFDVVVAEPGNVYNYETKRSFGPEDWRRSIYGHRIRGERDGTFDVFDCPDGAQVTAARSRSTTALQALSLLNGPFVIEQSDRFAERLAREGDSLEARVRLAVRLAYQREPALEELRDVTAVAREHGLSTVARALFNSNEFLFVP